MIDYDELDYEDETLFNPEVVSDKLARIVDGILKNPKVTNRNWGVEFKGFGSTQPRYRLFRAYPNTPPGISGLSIDTVPIEASIDSAVTKFSSHLEGPYDSLLVNENFTINNNRMGVASLDASLLVLGTIQASRIVATDTSIYYRDPFGTTHIGVDLARPQGVRDKLTF